MSAKIQVEQDLPKVVKLLQDVSSQVEHVKTGIQNLLKRVEDGELPTAKGISFLEIKYHLLLSYLLNLTQVMRLKVTGKSIRGDPAVERLVEIRTVLEKVRPIDQKLKYQVDKLIKTAATGTISANDPLRFKPNPGNLVSKLEDEKSESESESEEEGGKPKVYRPPKIAAMHYDGDETEMERQQQAVEKAKKRALSSSIMKDLRDEYSEGPEEIKEATDIHKIKIDKMTAEREKYEEKYFTRMAVSKKEKQAAKQLTTMSSLNELTKFGDLSALSGEFEEGQPSKKRKRGHKMTSRDKRQKRKAVKKRMKRS